MAGERSWDRSLTLADQGYMHEESMDHMIADIYNRVDETNVIEDQTKYMFAIFNNPSYAESLNREFFRPIVRSEVSLGTTNFMTQAKDINSALSERSWAVLSDFLIRIIAHDNCYDAVIAVLAWHLVSSGVSNILPETLAVDIDEDLAKYVAYFESVASGSENTDQWTGRVTRLVLKWHISDMLGCSNSKVDNAEWYLKDICAEVFSEYFDKDPEY